MCGIGGFWASNEDALLDASTIDSFVDSLAHRGPDDRGIKIIEDSNIVLCHRRLSILDLSSQGHQPMERSAKGRQATIIFNGEIYNYQELRSELVTLGYATSTQTDTEVALLAYLHWGLNAFQRFNGMWAIAIYDHRLRRLVLCRDRYGIKPLFYYYDGKDFAFASELKAFHKLVSLNIKVSGPHLAAELAGRDLSADKNTILENVYQLPPGHLLIYESDWHSPRQERWWSTLDHLEDVGNSSYEAQVDRFRHLFADACRLRLRSDVPVATALSGGLDSSSVFGTCASLHAIDKSEQNINTAFVSCFPDSDLDESLYANEVIKRYSANSILVSNSINEIVRELDHVLSSLELVSYLPSVVSVYHLYAQMKIRGFSISMDGHGGDELLGGYLYFLHNARIDALSPCIDLSRYNDLSEICRKSSTPASQIQMAATQRRVDWIANTPANLDTPCAKADIERMREMGIFSSSLNTSLYLAFHYNSLPTILRNFDRASMANGVESRAPLLDYRIVNFCFSLDGTAKIGGLYSRRILRDAMKNVIPEVIRNRQSKVGFGSAFDQWLSVPAFHSWLADRLNSRAFLQSSEWDGKAILRHFQECISTGNHREIAYVWPFLSASYVVRSITCQ